MTDLLTAVLERAVAQPHALAMIGAGGGAVTYLELARTVLTAAEGLRRHGFRAGDTVVFAVRPAPAAVQAALAVVAAGGIVLVADPGAGPALARARAALTRPRWTMAEPIVHAATRGPGRRLAAHRGLALPDLGGPGLRHVLATPRRLPGLLTWGRLLADGAVRTPRHDPGADALAVFTSGTTAAPRAVRHTTATLGAGARRLAARLDLGPGDRVHTDQLMIALPTLVAGATWSAAPLGAPGPLWRRTATARRATVGYAVPATLAAAAADGPLPTTLRLLATGGAPLTPTVVRAVARSVPRARVVGVYGLTEALPVATVDGPDLLAHHSTGEGLLLGAPVPGTRVGTTAAGELWVAGPQVSPGHLGSPPHTRVHTGDLGRVLTDGRLVLLGRAKDMIVRGVTNIYPALVEPLVDAEPGVAHSALVGIPDPHTADEAVLLAVVPTPGTDPHRLRARLRRRLPDLLDAAWLPDDIVTVPDLPRSGRSAKIDKDTLRSRLAAR